MQATSVTMLCQACVKKIVLNWGKDLELCVRVLFKFLISNGLLQVGVI